jgi:hypothetical protein
LLAADYTSGNLYQIDLSTNSIAATIAPPAGEQPNTGTIQLLQMR